MRFQSKCDCCGHTTTAYTHTLNRGLLSAFSQLVDFYIANKKGANLQKDLVLSKNQFCNFQKLQYLQLTHRGNGRYPTELGLRFMKGEEQIYDTVATFGKTVMPPIHKIRETAKRKPKKIYPWDIDSSYYKQKAEYQREKSPQLSLF